MNGSGVWAEDRSSTVLIFEQVTGGGLAGRELYPSWAVEGSAMRRAICRDFASVPGVRVVSTLDARLPDECLEGVEIRTISDPGTAWFQSIIAEADYTLVIAPEPGDLSELTFDVEQKGGRLLGSGCQAIHLVGDKAAMARRFADRGIPSPPTYSLEPGSLDLPAEWDGPIVVKPRWGAGSRNTVVIRDRRLPSWVSRESAVAQPYLPGEPMSASFLVDLEGHPTLLAVGRQRIEVDDEGRISYRGGIIPAELDDCPSAVVAAVASVVRIGRFTGVRGFVGVDFLLDDRGQAVVLEINPRPTTSIVGLAKLFPPGTIAGAWLAAVDGPLEGTDWPDRIRRARTGSVIWFDADGTIHPEGISR